MSGISQYVAFVSNSTLHVHTPVLRSIYGQHYSLKRHYYILCICQVMAFEVFLLLVIMGHVAVSIHIPCIHLLKSYFYLCVCVWVCGHVCKFPGRPEEGIRSSEAEVISSYGLPDVGAGL